LQNQIQPADKQSSENDGKIKTGQKTVDVICKHETVENLLFFLKPAHRKKVDKKRKNAKVNTSTG
jgi:hypothetical protein